VKARAARGGSRIPLEEATRKVLLFPDTYTNYNHPRAGKAAVQVLETAGIHVEIPDGVTSTGPAGPLEGFLDRSRERARTNVEALAPRVEDGEVVLVEPSDAVMLQSDYLDLLSGRDAERVAANTYGVMEYLDRFDLAAGLPTAELDERLTYHGHTVTRKRRRRTVTRPRSFGRSATRSTRLIRAAVGWRAPSATRPSTTR